MKNKIKGIVLGAAGAHRKITGPLYASRPTAGFPAPADDLVEKTLDLNDLVVKNPSATFYVRVQGDSMIDAGINDNDVLVVDRSLDPKDGSIVLAAVYGELVVKRLHKSDSNYQLISANKSYKAISITDNEDCYIWGVVVGSVRTF